MGKYVNKSHGLILGSGNIFFICDDTDAPEGVPSFRDGYRAIVWTNGYHFENITSLNCFIINPAEQLLWDRQIKVIYPEHKNYYTLKNWPRTWLENNVGPIYKMWDVKTEADRNDCIFFKRRKDALAFVKAIDEVLKIDKEKY